MHFIIIKNNNKLYHNIKYYLLLFTQFDINNNNKII